MSFASIQKLPSIPSEARGLNCISFKNKSTIRLLTQPLNSFCIGIIILYSFIAILGFLNLLPDYQSIIGESNQPPSWEGANFFGTDVFGRSVLYKILAGTKTAMLIGTVTTLISVPLGLSLGIFAGYYRGGIDSIIVWLYSVIVAVPHLLLIAAFSLALGKGLVGLCIGLGAISWVGLCRLIRGEVLKQNSQEYVIAAKVVGATNISIMLRHILPNVSHLTVVATAVLFPAAIRSEVILTFLGIGIQSDASWGNILSNAHAELAVGIWWPLTGTTLAMFFIIYALSTVSDAIRDIKDPRVLR